MTNTPENPDALTEQSEARISAEKETHIESFRQLEKIARYYAHWDDQQLEYMAKAHDREARKWQWHLAAVEAADVVDAEKVDCAIHQLSWNRAMSETFARKVATNALAGPSAPQAAPASSASASESDKHSPAALH